MEHAWDPVVTAVSLAACILARSHFTFDRKWVGMEKQGATCDVPTEKRQQNVEPKVLPVGAVLEVDGQGREEDGGCVEDALACFVAHGWGSG